jgi:hypothetical protein
MGFDDLKKIIGIDPGPVRLHCATLSLKALKGAVFFTSTSPWMQRQRSYDALS